MTPDYVRLLCETPRALLAALRGWRLPTPVVRAIERYAAAETPLPPVWREALVPVLSGGAT